MCSILSDASALAAATSAELIAVQETAAAELTGREAPEDPVACMELAERLAAVIDKCEAALAPLVGRVHTGGHARTAGFPSTQAWLRARCGMRGGKASERVTMAVQLPRLARTAKRFAAGELSYGYAATITNSVSRLSDEDTEAAEDLLLRRVDDGWSTQRLARYATRIHDAIITRDGTEPEPEDTKRGYRHSWLNLAAGADGGAYVKGWLNPEDTTLWRGALDPLSKPAGADDPRDHAERYADAMASLLSGGGKNWGATVIIDYRTLHQTGSPSQDAASGSDRPWPRPGGAWFPDGTPVSAERARQLALNAGISALILGPSGLPLYLGRGSRLVTAAQRRALEALYQTCGVDDCDIPATVCEIDHVTGWTLDEGPSDIDNLAPLCRFHNGYKAAHPDRVTAEWRNQRWHYTAHGHQVRPRAPSQAVVT